MPRILITGAAGFIGSHLVDEFSQAGYDVVGLDNFSKYGPVTPSRQKGYQFVQGDAKDVSLLTKLLADCDHFIAGAAMIGGIAYFHRLAFDLLAENERITAAAFEAAIAAHRKGEGKLRKITVMSSSMVFENATEFPTPEGAQHRSPPPTSTYGFQKLATEYFAIGAKQQYGLPYTIVRPFNCVGIGERRARTDEEVLSGDVRLAMSHVVPDLIQKILKGQRPLHLLGNGTQVRHYTYGKDLARGVRACVEHSAALNEDFNISTAVQTSVQELAERIWSKVHGPDVPLECVYDPPFPHDVQFRSPNVDKAQRVLGFEATTPLDTMLDEIIPWIREQIALGTI